MALIWSAFENHNLSKDEENRILKWCLVRCGGTAETVEAGVKFFLREKDSGKVEASSGSNAKLTRSNSGFVADHGYRMSSGMILRFLDAELEQCYAEDVQALSARNLKIMIKMTSAFLVPINLYWIMSRVALSTWSSDPYFFVTNFGPLLVFLGVLIIISMVPRFVSQKYCEFLVLSFQIIVQTFILAMNRFRHVYLGFYSEQFLGASGEDFDPCENDFIRVTQVDLRLQFCSFVLMGIYFSVANVRSKFNWLLPATMSAVTFLNAFLTPPEASEYGRKDFSHHFTQFLFISVAGIFLWGGDHFRE